MYKNKSSRHALILLNRLVNILQIYWLIKKMEKITIQRYVQGNIINGSTRDNIIRKWISHQEHKERKTVEPAEIYEEILKF